MMDHFERRGIILVVLAFILVFAHDCATCA